VGGIAWAEGSAGSFGGTQLMGRELERRLPADLLNRFQIHLHQVMGVDRGRMQIYWCHILNSGNEYDPTCSQLANGGWKKFHRIVFVSNWQARSFIHDFGIPWSRCVVMHNAIEPIPVADDKFDPVPADRPIRLIYTPVPGRGLHILYHVFKKISEDREDVELDVYSSFKLYGWQDGGYEELFDALKRIPRVSYHGAVSNQQLRSALASSHVFAYPSVYRETSCICLMEAMSAGLACVHPDYGALSETAANCTVMYKWPDDISILAALFYQVLNSVIDALRAGDKTLLSRLANQKAYADRHYNWDLRAAQWEQFLRGILQQSPGD
jgi:UDP-glucose:(glucosyl)LPS alpha-1,2-glucosyltransferase